MRRSAAILRWSVFAAIVIALASLSVSAEQVAGTRVLVVPFDDKVEDFKDSNRILTDAAIAAVKASGKFTYISPEKFSENWMKVLTESERKLFKSDPAAEMKDLKKYRRVFVHEDLGTIAEYRDRWGVDLVIIGAVIREDELGEQIPKLYMEIISLATGRFYNVGKKLNPDAPAEIVKKEVDAILAKGADVQKVDADGILLPSRSVAGYDLRAKNGQYLRLAIDYSSERPDPAIQKIDIAPHKPVQDGILLLEVDTKEKKPVKFQYFYKKGQFMNLKIYTDPPAKAEGAKAPEEESLSAVSVGGYTIKFIFKWKDGEVAGIRAEPLVNPYQEVK